MMSSGRVSSLWQRYLFWRSGEGVRLAALPVAPINKLAIDEGDIAVIVTANISGDSSGH